MAYVLGAVEAAPLSYRSETAACAHGRTLGGVTRSGGRRSFALRGAEVIEEEST